MQHRSLLDITREIRQTWVKGDGTGNVWFGARPYLEAMEDIARSGNDHSWFYNDPAEMVVRYFISNAATWRGEAARRIKAELRAKYGIK